MTNPNGIFIHPPYEAWNGLLLDNINSKKRTPRHPLAKSIRAQALASAIDYHNQLVVLGRKNKLSLSTTNPNINRNLIATGHQPTVYHEGITAKYDLLKRYCAQYNASGLNLIIDTDHGDAGEFFFPKLIDSKVVIAKTSLVENKGAVFAWQKLTSANNITAIHKEVLKELKLLDIPAYGLNKAFELYTTFAEQEVVSANTIIRRLSRGDSNYLDLPLSRLIDIPEVKDFLLSYLLDYKSFFVAYNSILDEYRTLQKIENTANPFPNLRTAKDLQETPFWLIDRVTGNKFSLFLKEAGARYLFGDESGHIVGCYTANDIPQIFNQYYLSPKAFLISLMLRTMLSDLYINGRGGAKYDKFTDYYLSCISEPAYSFVTVSRDSYLFDSRLEIRDIMYHPEKHLLDNLLPPASINRIRILQSIKTTILSHLEKATTKKLKIGFYTRIKRANRLLLTIINKTLNRSFTLDKKVQSFRKFPFFFFDL